ncbi:MAG: GNAT family N-acetyltransferase [Bacilli bacterium]|nr:GNAT family N-acetyltransferase [Bacilli bacterium]
MEVKRYDKKVDYERVLNFLKERYLENKNMECWLPARFDDLVHRIDTLYRDERGKEASSDYIFIYEEEGEIVGLITPDGDSFNSSIKRGYEYIFKDMLDLAEKELTPLFERDENGEINFLVVSHDSLTYQAEELKSRGYVKDTKGDFDNCQHPMETNYIIDLPEGFKQVYGNNIDDNMKAKACHYGFHPSDDDGILTGSFREGILAYQSRKNSKFYKDSFESLIVSDEGDICTYCFCYVDKITSTAFVEPVCTREKYRHRGFAKQMLYGVINKLKEMEIENAYINSYDWRVKVYNSAGFVTEDSIGFWYKKIK